MANDADQRLAAVERELADVRRELGEFRAFFKETIAHYDELLPERLAISRQRRVSRS
jgi:hypothetical protein